MDGKTINSMKRPELLDLIKETINDINTIRSSKQWAIDSLGVIKSKEIEINGNEDDWIDGLVQKANQWYDEIDEKIELIKIAYNEILIDWDEEWEESLKTQIEELLATINQDKTNIESFRKEFFGYTDEETQEEIAWVRKEIEDFFEEQQNKYDEFYEKIDKELNAWVTSVKLAKTFSDKVVEYKEESKKLSNYFIWILLWAISYYAIGTFLSDEPNDINKILIYLLHNLPLIASISWLAIFISNRRAEAKKLEESYVHKEIMARSFMGYKESVKELNTEDNQLLGKHMDNLLTAIGKDSSEFLIEKWESHPLIDFMKDLIGNTKIPTSINDMLSDTGIKIEIGKK